MNRIFDRIAVEPPNVTQDCKARAVRAPHVPHAPAASPRRAPFRRWLASRPVRVGGACLPPVTSSSSRADVARIHKPRPGPALLRAVLGPRTVRASRLEKAEHAMQPGQPKAVGQVSPVHAPPALPGPAASHISNITGADVSESTSRDPVAAGCSGLAVRARLVFCK